jgi:hypothetical protein
MLLYLHNVNIDIQSNFHNFNYKKIIPYPFTFKLFKLKIIGDPLKLIIYFPISTFKRKKSNHLILFNKERRRIIRRKKKERRDREKKRRKRKKEEKERIEKRKREI